MEVAMEVFEVFYFCHVLSGFIIFEIEGSVSFQVTRWLAAP